MSISKRMAFGLGLCGMVAAGWLVFRAVSFLRARTVMDRGMSLTSQGIDWSVALRDELGLPEFVYTRSEAVKYLLLSARRREPVIYRNAPYFLARYLLATDCEQAEFYLVDYLENGGGTDQPAKELLRQVRVSGCASARAWIDAVEGRG